MDLRTATLNNGGDLQLVGEDGQKANYARNSAVVLLPALKTVDALWTPALAGSYAVYERHGGMVSGATNYGGDLTFLSVGAPVATPAPAILISPASQTVPEFSTATFAVVASGSGLAYQWQSNGVAIVGQTTASYSFPNVNRTNTGALFSVVVSGTGGAPVTSANATLTVVPAAPIIATQPASITMPPVPGSLWVVATGSTPMTYQWFMSAAPGGPWTPLANGGAISGATTSNLLVSFTSPTNGGFYQVVVTGPVVSAPGVFVAGAGATVTSLPAELRIGPAIPLNQPVNVTVNDRANATFSVAATGTGLTYQWSRQAPGGGAFSPIAGATGSSYTLTPAYYLVDNQSHYQVVVTGDTGGSATSRSALLTVLPPPNNSVVFLTAPSSLAVAAGVPSVSFTAVVDANTANPGFGWYRSDNSGGWGPALKAGNNRGAWFSITTVGNKSTLTVEGLNQAAIDLGQAGVYEVRVASPGGGANRKSAGLTVTQTFAGAPVTDIPAGNGGTATPYPAALTAPVPALLGAAIQHANVTLTLTDPMPFDADMLIASPPGATNRSVEFMAGVGPAPAPGVELPPLGPKYYFYGVTNCVLTFDDAAAAPASTNYWLAAGTYQPTVFPMGTNWMTLPLLTFPVSAATSGRTFSTLNGFMPVAGAWRLYINDNASDLAALLPANQTEGNMPSWGLTLTAGPPPGQPLPQAIGTPLPTSPPAKVTATQPVAAN